MELKLAMRLEDVGDAAAFRGRVVADVAAAAAVEPAALRVVGMRAGSVVVDLALAGDATDARGRGAQEVAEGLERQAKDPGSALLKGAVTRNTVSLLVKGRAGPGEQPEPAEAEAGEAPKASTHAQKVQRIKRMMSMTSPEPPRAI
jgi:hypothetical protein